MKTNIDRSSRSLNNLSNTIAPEFKEETLFLKVLIEGKSNLYYFEDGNLIRFFYKTETIETEQLIYKSYITHQNTLKYNNSFRRQLSENLKCKNVPISVYKPLEYNKKDLINIFTRHNTCNNQEFKIFSTKNKKGHFNFSLKARLINSSFEARISSQETIDFGNKTALGFGFEIESILSLNKNKWAIVAEPSLQSYKSQITIETPGSNRDHTLSIDYKILELALGVRHYLFLNSNSKFFINAFFVLGSPMDSKLKSIRGESTATELAKAKGSYSLSYGIGYKFLDKYSLELRHKGAHEILDNRYSAYQSTSLVFGYTIF